MKFESKNIADATPAELRAFAQSFLGIPVDGMTDAKVAASIRAAHEGETIFVTKADEPSDQTGSPPPEVVGSNVTEVGKTEGGLGRNDPKVQIMIHSEERDGVVTSHHKEVGVNGQVWLLKRGVSLTVPYRVYEVLNNAERDAITHDGQGEVVSQKMKSTPFNVERMPPQAEIDAWRERVSKELMPE